MARLKIKGLLYDNLDELYQNSITAAFKSSKLSREEFTKKYEEKLDEYSDAFEKSAIKTHADIRYKIKFATYHKSIIATQKAIAQTYKDSFTYYFSYLSACHVILNKVLKQLDQFETNQTDHVVIPLYAHLLRKVDQIGIMLLNGYDDAALVLWRAFYEFSLVCMLIAEEDSEDLSKRFTEHTIRHSKRMMDSYQSRLSETGFEAISDDEQRNVNDSYQRLSDLYGKEFVEGDYSWIKGVQKLEGKKTTLRAIEDVLDMGKFRPFYIWASSHTHASFEVFKEVTFDNKIYAVDITDSRPDFEDLIDPMQITINVLHEVNESVLRLISDEEEGYLNLELLHRLYLKLLQTFDPEAGKDIPAGQ